MQDVENLNSPLHTREIELDNNENDGDVWQGIASGIFKPDAKPAEHGELPAVSKPTDGQHKTAEDVLREFFEPRDRTDRFTELKKHELLTKTARDIAKAASFDGTMSKEEKAKLKDAFQEAYDLGCEKDLVKAINDQLKGAGSKHRVFLDTRQNDDDERSPIKKVCFSDRNVTVVNSDNGEVTDSHKFSIMNIDVFRPPIYEPQPWPRPRIITPDLINPPERPYRPIDRFPDEPRLDPPGGDRPHQPRTPHGEPIGPIKPGDDIPDWMKRHLPNALENMFKKAGK